VPKAYCPACKQRTPIVRGLCTQCYDPSLQLGRMPTDSETAGLLDLFGARLTGETPPAHEGS
jgi:hypothetical protein